MIKHVEPTHPTALSYSSSETRCERPYGRADLRVFLLCTLLAASHGVLAGWFWLTPRLPWEVRFHLPDRPADIVWELAKWGFPAAYAGVWFIGQFVFWTSSRHLPPVSAFALACVAALALLSLVVNLLLSR